jgi:hypothetical protein
MNIAAGAAFKAVNSGFEDLFDRLQRLSSCLAFRPRIAGSFG